MIRRCTNCAKLLAPFTVTCSSCQSDILEWVPSSGEGSIVSWKVLHRASNGHCGKWELSIITIVELDDGPWVYTTIKGDAPPPSNQPVRVRFESEPTNDRFPVFTIHTANGRHADRRPSPEHRLASDPACTQSRTHMKTDTAYGSAWIRSSLNQCDFLEAAKSVDADARSVIEFAIRCAPFGGASADELLVAFGVTRWRFVKMIGEALRPRAGDSRTARALKCNLLDALTWGWRVYPDSSASHARV
ncbi:Zn-ribbon domain-containing OB-fold protein [Nocardia gipuzkoensis]